MKKFRVQCAYCIAFPLSLYISQTTLLLRLIHITPSFQILTHFSCSFSLLQYSCFPSSFFLRSTFSFANLYRVQRNNADNEYLKIIMRLQTLYFDMYIFGKFILVISLLMRIYWQMHPQEIGISTLMLEILKSLFFLLFCFLPFIFSWINCK